MPTRFNSSAQSRFGVAGLQSGYARGSASLRMQGVGIEDVDIALFRLFDKEIPLQCSTSDKNREQTMRVPVIFASAEKWALSKRQRAVRDRNGSLILPLMTVVRTSIQQGVDDITGRGINQQTGELVIARRLDASDRGHQLLTNRLALPNQRNLAFRRSPGDVGLQTSRTTGDMAVTPGVQRGGLLVADRTKNVVETLVVPAPQFFTATYDVTVWTQFTVQMSQVLETLIASFLPQGNAWRLDTPDGYWFVAYVDGNMYNAEHNVDDMSQEERVIRYGFSVKVPAYVLATSVPGAPNAVRRYVSAPSVSFDVGIDGANTTSPEAESNVGADDPTLPLEVEAGVRLRSDMRRTGATRLYPQRHVMSPHDPALSTRGRPRVRSRNSHMGETSYAAGFDLGALDLVVTGK